MRKRSGGNPFALENMMQSLAGPPDEAEKKPWISHRR